GAEPLLALPQGLFSCPAGRQVLDDPNGTSGPAIAVADQGGRDVHPDRLAVLADVPLVVRVDRHFSPEHPAEVLPVLLPVLGVGEVAGGEFQEFFGTVAGDLPELP